jgi:outer membrane protein OmpA-like peptidoglycan-associated protein
MKQMIFGIACLGLLSGCSTALVRTSEVVAPPPVVEAVVQPEPVAPPPDPKQIAQGLVQNLNEKLKFASNETEIPSDAIPTLKELAEIMALDTSMQLGVGGFADTTGIERKNKTLSEKRASEVRQILVQNGASSDRVSAKGYGTSKPVAPNNTPEGRKQNRRAEVALE